MNAIVFPEKERKEKERGREKNSHINLAEFIRERLRVARRVSETKVVSSIRNKRANI